MRRLFATALGLLILAGSADSAPARANGVGPFDDVWVARKGEAYPGSGSSCARPHAVADGVDDQSELNWAVQHLNDHGTLHLCAGTFHLTNPIGRLAPCAPGCYFALPTHLTISGAGMRKTILDGGATYSGGVRTGPGSDIIWEISDEEELTLSDLTVQNAVEPNGNGAAVSSGADVHIIRARFYRNETAAEGSNLSGAAIDAPNITIIDSIFAENTADGNGGAIDGIYVEVSGSLFRGNSANGKGGAINAASVVVTNSRFTGNVSLGTELCKGGGGAIYARQALTIHSGTFDRNRADAESCAEADPDWATNSAGFGGAVYLEAASSANATISNATFSRNSAAFAGGAAALLGELNLALLTFTANASGGWGGALFYIGQAYEPLASGFASLIFRRNVAQINGGAIYVECAGVSEATGIATASRYASNRDRTAPYSPNYFDNAACP